MPRRNLPRFPVLDGHCDSLILREVRDDPLTFAAAAPTYSVDLPRMRRGGLDAAFVMVGDSDLRQSLRLIEAVHRMAEDRPRDFALCRTAGDVLRARRRGQMALLMSIEGQAMFEDNLNHLRTWQRLGVSLVSLTHGEGRFGGGRPQPFALQHDAAFAGYLSEQERRTFNRQSKGLTPFARDAIREAGRRGLILDLSHTTDKAFWEALELCAGPVCFSHGCCYALCPHTRNMTDDMMKALAQRGGVLGICFWGNFIDARQPTLDRLCDHFLHALDVMGPDHVGVGTDFDGIPLHQTCVIPDAAGLPKLWAALERRGVPRKTLLKIASGNFLRLLPKG